MMNHLFCGGVLTPLQLAQAGQYAENVYYQVGPVGRGAGDGVQIDTARQTAAPLVVGVVAAQLRPSWSDEDKLINN